MGKSMGMKTKILVLPALLAMMATQSIWAGDAERAMAKRIHDRLTGISATNAVIDAMEATLDCSLPETPGYPCDGTGENAARYAIDTTQHNPDAGNPNAYAFYNVTLKNFAAPWTNEEQTVFAPLNDYSATIVGAIRDEIDFRRILYDDLLYLGDGITPGYANDSNAHYEALEALDPKSAGNLADQSILVPRTQSSVRPGIPAAGIMTSRAGAKAFFSAGTNRAMFRFTLMNHLCTDLEPIKDVSRAPDYVRRDVSRSPGGDSRLYMNGCVGCHAGMDGMAGAFAKYEWDTQDPQDPDDGIMLYAATTSPLFGDDGLADGIPDDVSLKHNINANNFEYGHAVTDDSWINYWRNGPNSKLGVRPPTAPPNVHPAGTLGWGHPGETLDAKGNAIGTGASSLGVELANSKAFAQCQVDKAFEAVCLRDPNVMSADRSARDGFVSNFVGSGYNMREVFTDVAAYCKGS